MRLFLLRWKRLKKVLLFQMISLFLLLPVLIGCSSGFEKASPVLEKEVSKISESPANQGWEVEWDKTLTEAKKEGWVIIASGSNPPIRHALSTNFEKKYDIKLEWIVGPWGTLPVKILSERKAGLYTIDINQNGNQPVFVMLKPEKVFEPILPNLILPEVKDEKAYWQSKYPMAEKDGLAWSMSTYLQEPMAINTDFVKKEDIVSYYDLLKPMWKGKIVMGDPTTGAGGAFLWFAVMVDERFGPILGLDYMKELTKQDPILIRDTRLGMEWILRGKYPVGLVISGKSIRRDWVEQGIRVPIEEHTPREGAYFTAGGTMISIMNKAPHPNAAKIFINWLFSREGQIIYSKAQGQQSTRIDIPPPEEIGPDMSIRVPGVKYVNGEEEDFVIKAFPKYVPVSREIFGALSR